MVNSSYTNFTSNGLALTDPTNPDGTPFFQADSTGIYSNGTLIESNSSATAITAHAGGGQASGTLITAAYSLVTVCATNFDSVKLPVILAAGVVYTIKNIGAAILSVFPNTGATINGLAVNLSIDIPVGGQIEFTASSTTAWRTPVVITSLSPTTQTGNLIFKAAASAGNTQTTVTNASQAAARTYTIPDAGTDASFAMTQGAQTLVGVQTFSAPIVLPIGTTITAFAGGGQASATALTKQYNLITTCATNFDSVKLLTAVAGQVQTVKNIGAAILSVFPFSGDAINAMAVNLSIDIPVGGEVTFTAIDATTWYTNLALDLPSPSTQKGNFIVKAADNASNVQVTLSNASFAQASVVSIPDVGAATGTLAALEATQTFTGTKTFGAIVRSKATNAITAFATGGQASATQLTSEMNSITVCATALDSVKLPTSVAGMRIQVNNLGAALANVYPISGDLIDALAANTPIQLAVGGSITFTCAVAGSWVSSQQLVVGAKFGTGTTTTTFTAGQLTGAQWVSYASTAATPGSISTRTATQMFNDDPYARVGGGYRLRISNTASAAAGMTITAGGGVTLTGTATVADATYRDYVITYTSATALVMQNIGSGSI